MYQHPVGPGRRWKTLRPKLLNRGDASNERAQAGGTNLVGLFIGLLVAGIVVINVFIPVINDAIADSNVSGTTETILGLLGMFSALLLLVALASPLMRRV